MPVTAMLSIAQSRIVFSLTMLSVAGTVMFCSAANTQALPHPYSAEQIERIERFVSERADHDYAFVIGVIDANGSRVFAGGRLGKETELEVDGRTVFEIGSITKTMTSLLCFEMAEQGEVSVDDPVAMHLPSGT
ncbi:MAG: serine hydrolase, partial [Desulfobacterales bacterium]|nr:serine hydrolase [Desulfobacterales bacterium]